MLKWSWAALWLAGAAMGQTSATLAVLAGFDSAPTPGVLRALHTELAALYAPVGLSPEWYPLETPSSVGRPEAVVAVRFTGACRWDWMKPARAVTGTLAWTARVDGELQPHITVDCTRVAAYAGPPTEALLGRALARVVAHELYHYLTQQTAHTHTVLSGPSFRPRDLLQPEVGFDASEVEALRAALAHSAARPLKLKAS